MASTAVTELVYLTFREGVKPEDPENYDGRVFTDTLEAVKLQSGYLYSSWGRTVADENDIVWVVCKSIDSFNIHMSELCY